MDLIVKLFGWAVRFFAGVFVALHLYAFALTFIGVPGTVLMGQRMTQGMDVRRSGVALEDISPHMIRAVIAAEDTRFCEHEGVDPDAIRLAIDDYNAGKPLRGASTITQQTAKNVFFWNGGGVPRKIGDAWMGTFVDHFWGKRRVMEIYLNVAEWGDGIFGIEAAAQVRFGKSAADLNSRESALLAAVLPSPHKWRVDPPGPYVTKRAATIEARMRLVSRDGLDTCVWGDTPPPAVPAPRKSPETPPETPETLPDLPDGPPDLAVSAPQTDTDYLESKGISTQISQPDIAPGPPDPLVANTPEEGADSLRSAAPNPSPSSEADAALDEFLDALETPAPNEPDIVFKGDTPKPAPDGEIP